MKLTIITAAASLLLIGGIAWSSNLAKNDPTIIATNGLHWHPRLAIYVKGEKQEIPANVGLGAVHLPMHTHSEDSADGVIHLEFGGTVRTKDILLGNFFTIWNKDMRSLGTNMRMMVNDQENTEYENYVMHDGDQIVLNYE